MTAACSTLLRRAIRWGGVIRSQAMLVTRAGVGC